MMKRAAIQHKIGIQLQAIVVGFLENVEIYYVIVNSLWSMVSSIIKALYLAFKIIFPSLKNTHLNAKMEC